MQTTRGSGADAAEVAESAAGAGDGGDSPVPPALTSAHAPRPLSRYWHPRFWPAWCLWLWMRLTASLPLSWALFVHRGIGRLLHRLLSRQRRIVRRNLELCFPELSADQRAALGKRHFEALGAAFAESAAAWFASDRRLERCFDVIGIEHLNRALQGGKGVILYTGHFTALEICGRPMKRLTSRFACMFSHRSNELLDELQRRGRLRSAHEVISNDSVRSMLTSLKRNAVVWYAPDQAYRGRGAALIPFFHELAMTNTAPSRLARVSGATVIPFSYRRLERSPRYELVFHAPLSGFPSGDSVEDTRRLVQTLEASIRDCPEQYLWLHRRFKERPSDLPDLYSKNHAVE